MKPKVIAIERKIIEIPNEELTKMTEGIMKHSIEMRDVLIDLQNQFADSMKKFKK